MSISNRPFYPCPQCGAALKDVPDVIGRFADGTFPEGRAMRCDSCEKAGRHFTFGKRPSGEIEAVSVG